ncbi:hypothetical protein HYU17_00570 [Candidatus Woesearchaeota archaeon]|nr:hypothetical protein [Candidatus Woesearchaeota archaeon]
MGKEHSAKHISERFKKGQFGLLDIASYLLFFVSVAILILLLNLGGQFLKNKEARASLDVDVNLASFAKADAQLDSYLRTDLPGKDELLEKIQWLEENKNKNPYITELKKQLDLKKAREILEAYPEVYEGKDYSGFISGLHALYYSGEDRGKVWDAFRAVTAVMFLRSVKDYPKRGEFMFYLLPVGVDFDPEDLKPSSNEDLCGRSGFELCIRYFPEIMVPQMNKEYEEASGAVLAGRTARKPARRFSSQAVQAIPVANSGLAKVEFRYYHEFKSWLPQA